MAKEPRAGKIVRLAQGDPDRQTVYGDDPRQQAEIFKAAGAEWVHVINLSGAFNEDADANLKALEGILSVGLKVEFGGGIRDEETVRIPLEMGVERAFLGTAAIKSPELVDWAVANYGVERIVCVKLGLSLLSPFMICISQSSSFAREEIIDHHGHTTSCGRCSASVNLFQF